MDCSTGKNFYYNKEAAEEALITALGENEYPPNTGPINVYHCPFCDGYHLTSKGEQSPLLTDTEVVKRIAQARRAANWGFRN